MDTLLPAVFPTTGLTERGICLLLASHSPSATSLLRSVGGEYLCRGHPTPRRFPDYWLNRAGNMLASRVPLPVRNQLASFCRRGISLPWTPYSPPALKQLPKKANKHSNKICASPGMMGGAHIHNIWRMLARDWPALIRP